MNRSMRRKDRQMNQEIALELLQQSDYGVLSSVDANGQPYGVPVNFVFIGQETIYFHCAKEGHKLDNLKVNPKVCFTEVGDSRVMDWEFTTAYESVIAFGIACEVETDEKYQALRMLALKFSPDYMDEFEKEIEKAIKGTVVIKIMVEQINGKARPYEPQQPAK